MGLKLIGEVALDGSGFERGLSSMASSVKGFVAGAFGLYAVETMIRKTIDTADELANASKRLGVTAEQLQVLGKAAKNNGSDLDTLTKSFEKLDVAREKALSGSKEGMVLRGRFQQLGISTQDLQSKTAADLFTGPMRQAALTMNPEVLGPILKSVMGKGAGELIGTLTTDFAALQKKMEDMGLIMSTETTVRLKLFGEELSLLSTLVVNALGPAIIKLVDWLLWAVSHKGFMRNVLEGADFKLRELAGKSSLPDGSVLRHDAALAALDMIQKTDLRKTTPEQFRAQWADYFTNGLGADRNPEYAKYAKAFADDKSTSWSEEMAHLNKMIQPVEDVTNAAGKAAGEDMDNIQKAVEETQKNIAAAVEKAKHPTPPDFGEAQTPAEKKPQKKPHQVHERQDALIRVGNFLGSSKDVLEDIGRRQVELLQQIANNTQPQTTAAGSGDMSDEDFGLL